MGSEPVFRWARFPPGLLPVGPRPTPSQSCAPRVGSGAAVSRRGQAGDSRGLSNYNGPSDRDCFTLLAPAHLAAFSFINTA